MIKLSDEQLQTIELLTQLQGGFTFLTGKAGTGKSTVIKEYIKENKSVVLAPTGIAAVNIGGETIHSFFGLRARPFSPSYIHPLKPWIFEGFNTMIIDEISMVRVDLMTCIEQSLRYGDKLRRPFGGKKIIAVGDLRQLPPVVDSRKKEEIQFLRHHYGGKIYFHHASIFKQMDMVKKILKTVYRQSGDLEYLRILDQIGVGQQNGDTLIKINARVDRPCRNTIWICSTNYTVNKHNGISVRAN